MNARLQKMSPDGKQLAFILNRNKLAVMDMKSRKVRMLTDGSTYRQRDGGFSYSWSPDSRWIALEIVDRKHDPYTDIALINVADGSLTNITNSGYFDAMPAGLPTASDIFRIGTLRNAQSRVLGFTDGCDARIP